MKTRETRDGGGSLEAPGAKLGVREIDESRNGRIGRTDDWCERPQRAIECGTERWFPGAQPRLHRIERCPYEARQRRPRQRAEIGWCIIWPRSFPRAPTDCLILRGPSFKRVRE